MNTFLKPKLITYIAASLLFYYACPANQTIASGPQLNNKKAESDINEPDQQGVIGRYYAQILKQFAALNKNDLQAQNLIDNQGKISGSQLSKKIQSLPINDQVSKSLGFVKGLIYDPSNPAPFFNNLIALQSISAGAQSQLITLTENCLGAKNSYVLGLKESYQRTLKYVEALKQQKVLLEQAIPISHK